MIEDALATRGWLLADGATGTNLFAMGLVAGEAPEVWNREHPDRVRRLHQSFIDAGSDILLTNSFGCNRRRLALHKLEESTRELNRLAAENARAVANATDRPVLVAGSVGPTGDLYEPLGELTESAATEVFVEQMEGLKAGGADLVWIETMSSFEEIRAAARAAARAGIPYMVTASFDTAGSTMMGIPPVSLIETVTAFDPLPVAVGANCGVGASDLLLSILQMTERRPDVPIVAKGNCGIPRVDGDRVVYTGTPSLMADYARLAVDAGARILGGCCGTTPAHIAAMRRALDGYRAGERPDLARIVAALGPLTAPPPSSADRDAARRPRRRAAA
ncbi:MAG TPA: betaine--homocysteine S-methyltransferase [Stellaceae bacterium]|nr:betaine--homocysteine S-methyltransferase [Stellaceae bacterium]